MVSDPMVSNEIVSNLIVSNSMVSQQCTAEAYGLLEISPEAKDLRVPKCNKFDGGIHLWKLLEGILLTSLSYPIVVFLPYFIGQYAAIWQSHKIHSQGILSVHYMQFREQSAVEICWKCGGRFDFC